MFYRSQLYFRNRIKPCFNCFADKFSIRLRILQTYNLSIIVYTVKQTAAVRIGKG